jgi:hypothetical protein
MASTVACKRLIRLVSIERVFYIRDISCTLIAMFAKHCICNSQMGN